MQFLAIIIEVLVVIVSLMAAQAKKRRFVYGFAYTYSVYVLFDAARYFSLNINHNVLDILFLSASLTALWAIWQLYKTR